MTVPRFVRPPTGGDTPGFRDGTAHFTFQSERVGNKPASDVLALENSTALFARLDHAGTVVSCSQAFSQLLELPPSKIIGSSIDDHRQRLDLPPWFRLYLQTKTIGHSSTVRIDAGVGAQQSEWVVSLYSVPGRTAESPETILFGIKVENNVSLKGDFEAQAYQDPLTGLFNRRYLESVIGDMLNGTGKIGFIAIDLDNFKTINDQFGHDAGDQVLQNVAQNLLDAVSLGDTVVRLGGDEFVLVVQHEVSDESLQIVASQAQREISRPFAVGGQTHFVQASVGTSIYPRDGLSLKPLMLQADTKMYEAKRGKSTTTRVGRPPVIESLGEAIRRDQVRPLYQPIVNLSNKEVCGYEALARWHHPNLGTLRPIEFIPAAEASGMIADLDKAMFTQVCRHVSLARTPDHNDALTFVNFSGTTLSDKSFRQFIDRTLAQFNLKASQFCIELTESIELNEIDPGRELVFELSDLGFEIALDDFGTGFSSLSLLKSLPVNWVKIDKSFIHGITKSRRNQRIVESIFHLSNSLEMKCVAEGIETAEEEKVVRNIGIKFGQGYMF